MLIASETAQKSNGNVPRHLVNTMPSAFPERSWQTMRLTSSITGCICWLSCENIWSHALFRSWCAQSRSPGVAVYLKSWLMLLHLAFRAMLVILMLLSTATFGLLHVYFAEAGSDWRWEKLRQKWGMEVGRWCKGQEVRKQDTKGEEIKLVSTRKTRKGTGREEDREGNQKNKRIKI